MARLAGKDFLMAKLFARSQNSNRRPSEDAVVDDSGQNRSFVKMRINVK